MPAEDYKAGTGLRTDSNSKYTPKRKF